MAVRGEHFTPVSYPGCFSFAMRETYHQPRTLSLAGSHLPSAESPEWHFIVVLWLLHMWSLLQSSWPHNYTRHASALALKPYTVLPVPEGHTETCSGMMNSSCSRPEPEGSWSLGSHSEQWFQPVKLYGGIRKSSGKESVKTPIHHRGLGMYFDHEGQSQICFSGLEQPVGSHDYL